VIEGLARRVPILLAGISDLRRFNFPEKHYCDTLDGFVSRIAEFENRLGELSIENDVANVILGSRSINKVGDEWIKFLETAS
jgi:hypothetical protein